MFMNRQEAAAIGVIGKPDARTTMLILKHKLPQIIHFAAGAALLVLGSELLKTVKGRKK